MTVTLDRPPAPTGGPNDIDEYTIHIEYSDNFNPVPTSKIVDLQVTNNNPPYLNEHSGLDKTISLRLPYVSRGKTFEYFIPLKGFHDVDVDDYLFLYCDKSDLPSWVKLIDNKLGY